MQWGCDGGTIKVQLGCDGGVMGVQWGCLPHRMDED